MDSIAIKDVITKVIENLQEKCEKDPAQRIWQGTADKETKKHVRPLALKNKKLCLIVDSSAWLYEMNLRKKNLLGAFKAQGVEIENITLRVGKV